MRTLIIKSSILLFSIILFACSSVLVTASGQRESAGSMAAEESLVPVQIRLGGLNGPTSVSLAPYIVDPARLGEAHPTSIETYASPDLIISQLLAGEVDIAAIPSNLASVLYNRGAGIQLLGISGEGVLYLVSDKAMSFEEIAGKTVHTISRGATPDVMLQAMAARYGLLAGEDYEIRYAADQTELAQNLIAGRVNLAVLPEPFVSRVIQGNPDLQIAVDLQDVFRAQTGLDYYPMTAIVVSKSFAEKHPRAVRAFTDDMSSARTWLDANIEEAAAAAGAQIGMPAAILKASYPRLNLTWIPAADARQEIDTYLGIFYDFNPASVGGSIPAADFYFQE
ncbi:ABC transporter substrate-binding protein [Spirochaeta dissipatitropha]